MSVQTFGLSAFRASIQRGLDLAGYAETLVRGQPELTLMAPAVLGIVCFRREWPGCDEAETERRGLALAGALEQSGTALVSSTRLAGLARDPALRPEPDQRGSGGAPGHRAFRHGWPGSRGSPGRPAVGRGGGAGR